MMQSRNQGGGGVHGVRSHPPPPTSPKCPKDPHFATVLKNVFDSRSGGT